MILRARGRTVVFPRRPLVMGILNLNDDSFSGDGSLDPDWAEARIRELIAEGADIVDIGAESARTNRAAISEDEEIRRLAPCLARFAALVADAPRADADQISPPLLSVNTWRPAVARTALAIAGDLLNDMGGLPSPENAAICAETGAALLIMHTVGDPKVPHTHIAWRDIVGEMRAFFLEKLALAEAAGLAREAIVLDPGIDFAKQRDDNLRVYRDLEEFADLGRPILLPISRKSVIGAVLGITDPRERDAGTIACLVAGMVRGAAIFRVHNVRAAHQAVRTMQAALTA
ncbi:MAG: dihydropteroate synthase [Terrimicrobiaceae bacterium]|nr:dihydropteroate synthase [Terrimicrobiaceae bacterium]